MRFRLPLLALTLTAALAAPIAEAQSSRNYGSVYTRFGVGERVVFPSSQSAMMGGAGVALRSNVYTSLANPALWSDQTLVNLAFGAQVEGLQAEDATGATSRLGGSALNALQVGVPLLSDRLGVSLSFQPYSRVQYLVARDDILLAPGLPGDTLSFRTNLEGEGGLQQLQLGAGWRLSPALSVGISGQAMFGVIEDRQRTVFTQPINVGETRMTNRTRMWGLGATAGAVATTSGLLGERDLLSVGAAVTLPSRLETRRLGTRGISLDQDTLRAETAGRTTLPLQVTAGMSYLPNARWALAADVMYEPWSDFQSDFAFGGYNPDGTANAMQDRFRVGGGFQFIPAGATRGAAYFARTGYRLGAYYDRGHYSLQEQDLSTLALTGGVSLPGLLPNARFDLGFEAGTRGTTEAGLVRDLFVRGTATLNFGERWFVRRRFG